jgi:hypothetical protein
VRLDVGVHLLRPIGRKVAQIPEFLLALDQTRLECRRPAPGLLEACAERPITLRLRRRGRQQGQGEGQSQHGPLHKRQD